MTTKKIPKLESTTDYSKFVLNSLNRSLHGSEKLEESMRKHGFRPSSPIHVTKGSNGMLTVKRGHNRLAVAMKLGLPVFYIVDNDGMSIFEWESDSKSTWSLSDFVTGYALDGVESYVTLSKFCKRFNLKAHIAASLLIGHSAETGNVTTLIKSGRFVAKEHKYAEKVGNMIAACYDAGMRFARKKGFAAALSRMARVPEFSTETFLAKVKLHPKMISDRVTTDEFLDEIEALYNYATKSKRHPLAHMAREISRSRSVVFGK